MQKILLGIIGLVIVVGIIAYFMQSSTDVAVNTPPVQNAQDNTQNTAPATQAIPTVNMLVLGENVSGISVMVARAALIQAGYIVIYRTDATGKVAVIGHSVVLGPGEHTNVPVTLDAAVKAKDVIVAVLYEDNGNGVFDIAGGDLPVVQGNAHVTSVDVIDVPNAATDASLAAGVEAYLKAPSDQVMKTATTTQKITTTTTTTTTTKDVLAVTIHGSNYKFSPSTITAKLGQTVRVTFVNDGGTHDFVIDEFKVKTQQLMTGKSETVEFVVDKKGTFKYYCSVGQHRKMGMEGTLTVE